MANAQWTQLGPGAGGQERAVYLRDKGTTFDFYVGSDVSGVWRTTGLNTTNWANPASYNYDFISDHEPMRFINEFYAPDQYTSDFLFVTNRSGIHKLNAATNALPMQKLWGTGQPFVNDIFISAEHTAGVHTLYFVTGNERVDNRMNHKDDNTNDFYWGTIDAATESTISNINSIKLNNLPIRPHVYCMNVDEKNPADQTDDEFMLGTDSGLYKFTLQQAIDAVANSGGVLPSSTQIGWPYLNGVIDSYDTIDKGNLLAVTDIMRYNSLQAPNDFMITIYGLGLFYWDNSTGTWTWQMNKLECRKQGPNSTYILYDPNNTQNPANFLDSANNFTRILPVNVANTRQGYLLFNEEPLKGITNGKAYIGIFYSPVISSVDIRPKGDWVALSASTNMTNNDYGWNTTRPCSNRNGMLLLPDNRLVVGASGNIFVTKDPITNNTGTVKWQQIYTSTVASSILDLPEYQHRGYVNTANKTIFPATDNEIWIGQADRLIFKSDDGVNGFYDIENPASPYTITYSGANTNIPKTDCWFINNNNVDASDQNIYIGIGEGYGTNIGNGHVMQVNKNKTDITQLGDQLIYGDPLKIMFTSTNQKYLLVNTDLNLNPQNRNFKKRMYYLNSSNLWTPITLGTLTGNTYTVSDFVVSKNGTKLFAIIDDGTTTEFYIFDFTAPGTCTLQCSSSPYFNNLSLTPRILKMYDYDNGNKYKVLCGTAPNANNVATSNFYEVYNTYTNVNCVPVPINNLFFQNLNFDSYEQFDCGITAIEINQHLNVVYVATMRNDNGAVSSHVYRANYDPTTGAINQSLWADVSNGMHNKAVIAMSTNGRSVCNESVYACLRGLGGWKLDLPQGTVNQITQADFSSSASITKSGILSGPVVCGTPIVTIDGANIGITDPTVTITVGPGQTLNIINGASLFACGDMWQGIINNGGTVNITNSTIEDAENALFSNTANSIFNITNSTFNKNYKNIVLQDFDFSSSSFWGNTFKCTTPLKTSHPQSYEVTESHFELTNVPAINIGGNIAVVADKNHFFDANFGIVSHNSTSTVLNNEFKNIGNPLTTQFNYYAAILLYDESNCNIGALGSTYANQFINCSGGILSGGQTDLIVKNNYFENCDYALKMDGNFYGAFDVTNNRFVGCNYALEFYDYQKNTTSVVSENLIIGNKNAAGEPINKVAIGVYQWQPIQTYINVNNNVIDDYPFSIAATSIAGNKSLPSLFENNTINYTFDEHQTGTQNYYGIVAQGCNAIILNGNRVKWVNGPLDASAFNNQVYSYFISDCQNTVIKGNWATRTGTGMYMQNNCAGTTVTCNRIVKCYPGFYFDNLNLPDQGTPNSSNYNTWLGAYNNAKLKVDGFFGNGANKVNWYYYGTPNAWNNPYCPEPYNPNVIDGKPIAGLPSPVNQCTDITPMVDTNAVNQSILMAVSDSTTNTNINPEAIYQTKQYAYETLSEDSSLVNSAVEAQFMQQTAIENIGQFRHVTVAINDGNLADAYVINNAIVDTLLLETNKLALNNIAIAHADTIYSFTPSDSNIFINIGMQQAAIGGMAVYQANSAMRKIKIDINIGSAKEYKNEIGKNNAHQLTITPNPSEGIVFIKANTPIKQIMVINSLGQTILLENDINSLEYNFDLTNLPNGVYQLKVIFVDTSTHVTKLCLIK